MRRAFSLQWIVFALPVLGFIGAGWTHRWITDDGFIYLRVVRQIGAGNGPVFNAGERVEAFTGALWVALLSVADAVLPLRLEWIAVLLGLAGSGAGLAFAMAGSSRLWRDAVGDAWLVPFGALVFASVLPAWLFTTSGLETGLVFAWLGGCLWILADWAHSAGRKLSAPRAVVLGLGWLVRPELALFSAGFLALVLGSTWRRAGWRQRAWVSGAMIALPLAYQIFRMGFYGSVVPNTAIAKEAAHTNWARGGRYFLDFAEPYWLWVPAIALLVGGYVPLGSGFAAARRWRSLGVVGNFALCAALHATYLVAVGGDYLHARLLLPSFFAVCAPLAVVPALRRHLAGLLVLPWAAAAALALRPLQYTTGDAFANGFALPMVPGQVTTDDFAWGEGGPRRRWYSGPGLYRQVNLLWYTRSDVVLKPDVRLPLAVLGGIGITGFAMGPEFHVLDVLGLADPLAAHLEPGSASTNWPRPPGHEKPLPAPWIAARLTPPGTRPDPAGFTTHHIPLLPATTGRAFHEQVAWARAALECSEIAELTRAATLPLTPSRFAANFLRSFAHARLRIPADPEQAYRRFCGEDTPPEVLASRSDP